LKYFLVDMVQPGHLLQIRSVISLFPAARRCFGSQGEDACFPGAITGEAYRQLMGSIVRPLYFPHSKKQSPPPFVELFADAGAGGQAGSSFSPTHLKSHDVLRLCDPAFPFVLPDAGGAAGGILDESDAPLVVVMVVVVVVVVDIVQ
jgi:hypothetical protein